MDSSTLYGLLGIITTIVIGIIGFIIVRKIKSQKNRISLKVKGDANILGDIVGGDKCVSNNKEPDNGC